MASNGSWGVPGCAQRHQCSCDSIRQAKSACSVFRSEAEVTACNGTWAPMAASISDARRIGFPFIFGCCTFWDLLQPPHPTHTQLCNPVWGHDPQLKKADSALSLAAIRLPNNYLLSFSIRNLAGQSCFNKCICWNLLWRFLEEKWLEFYYTLKLGNRTRTSWESAKLLETYFLPVFDS